MQCDKGNLGSFWHSILKLQKEEGMKSLSVADIRCRREKKKRRKKKEKSEKYFKQINVSVSLEFSLHLQLEFDPGAIEERGHSNPFVLHGSIQSAERRRKKTYRSIPSPTFFSVRPLSFSSTGELARQNDVTIISAPQPNKLLSGNHQ